MAKLMKVLLLEKSLANEEKKAFMMRQVESGEFINQISIIQKCIGIIDLRQHQKIPILIGRIFQ